MIYIGIKFGVVKLRETKKKLEGFRKRNIIILLHLFKRKKEYV